MTSKQSYENVGQQLKAAEFRGMVMEKLGNIEKQIKEVKNYQGDNHKRIETLENFNANVVGKFTVIGAVLIIAVNWVWDVGRDMFKK